MSIRLLSILVSLPLLAACDGILGLGEDKRVGVIEHYGDPVVITLPDTVQAGISFEVSIQTYGGGCHSKDGTRAQVSGLFADVTPYDIHSGAEFCTDILKLFDHRAMVTLRESGVAQIRFHGKQLPEDSLITVVREVVVD